MLCLQKFKRDPTFVRKSENRTVNEAEGIEALLGRGPQQAGSLLPTLFLCRHGETALNASGRLRGLSDPHLDAAGRRQAEALATTLAPTRPMAIRASPLRRTVQTAEAIAAACELTVQVCDDLIDRDYGPQNGRPAHEVTTTWGSVDHAPGVEPWGVRARTSSIGTGQGNLPDHERWSRSGKPRRSQLRPAGVPRPLALARAPCGPATDRVYQHPPTRRRHMDRGHCRPEASTPGRENRGALRI